MKQSRPPISNHRLARLLVWARLWLSWFGTVIVQVIEWDRAKADEITRAAARFAAEVVILRAMQTFKRRKLARVYGPDDDMPTMRVFRGSRLRKRLKSRDPISRFFAVLALLRDLDAEIVHFGRRIARGLTRWRSQHYAWANEATIAPPALSLTSANTS